MSTERTARDKQSKRPQETMDKIRSGVKADRVCQVRGCYLCHAVTSLASSFRGCMVKAPIDAFDFVQLQSCCICCFMFKEFRSALSLYGFDTFRSLCITRTHRIQDIIRLHSITCRFHSCRAVAKLTLPAKLAYLYFNCMCSCTDYLHIHSWTMQKQQQAKEAASAAAAAAELSEAAASRATTASPVVTGPQKGNLVHAWVMVLAGKR